MLDNILPFNLLLNCLNLY